MKRKEIKSKHAGVIILIFLATILVVPIHAEDEYHVIVTLQAPEPTSFGGFGLETALFEDGIVIGVFTGDIGEISTAGRAYIYDTDWGLTSTLQAPTPKQTESFGRNVDVLGDLVIISNCAENVGDLREAGKVYVFDSEGTPLTILQSPDPMAFGWFGSEIALSRDSILVAEIGCMEQGFLYAGSVYEYTYEGVYLRNVTSPAMKSEGCFGKSLIANEEFILVGEPGQQGNWRPVDIGSVYVYDHDWNLVTILQSPDQLEKSFFGFSTSMSGDYVVIGELWATVDGHEKAGRAHIYDTSWNHVATLQSPTPEDNAEFGLDVVIGGDIVVVGERRGDVESMNEGKAYVFDLEGNLLSTLISPAPFPSNQFGYSVETDGEIIVVCEADVEAGGESKAGKVHVFGLGEPTAEQPAPEEETTETESEPETESEKGGGIPGFPLESIVLSVALVVLVLWLIQRQR
ncbi:hypothetical protein ES703_20067 [subsurface metagenome]